MFQGSGFGSASTTTPFGSFTKPATTGFVAAPVFGSASTSLFGQTSQPVTAGLFGSTTAAPAFGQAQTTQPSFGGFSTGAGSTGLFGSQQNATTSGTGLFGSGATSAFGQTKSTFGGFSTQAAGGGLFGQQATAQQPQAPGTSIFGQSATTPGNTNIFGSSGFGSTLGSAANTGTGAVKFTAVTGTDTMVKGGASQTISTRHHCITCMKEYDGKSLEELRLEDYAANRKGPQQTPGGLFGGSAQPSLFGGGPNTSTTTSSLFGGDSKPLFGGTNTMGFSGTSNVFGSPSGSLFGKPAGAPVSFGAATTTAGSTFGFNTPSTSNPFGSSTAQVKPFGSTPQTSLFGSSTTQPTTGFGTQSSSFGPFGAQPTQNIGLFSQNKPTFNVGTSNTGFSFGQTPTTTTPASNMSLFGSKPTGTFGSTFGPPATGTGTAFGSFGSSNQNSLFSSGFKPATTGFSFGQTPTTSSSLGTGSTLGGGSFFGNSGNKSSGLFGGTNTGTSLFGSTGFGSTGTSAFGSGTGTNLGTSLNLGNNTLMGGCTFSSAVQNQTTINPLNQHILALASLPFGDTPLFKNLLPTTGKADELLKPGGSAAQKTILSGQNFKVSSQSNNRIKVRPLGATALTKKSLFEGLEDEVPEGSHVSRLNPRRLVLKPKRQDDDLNVDTSAVSPVSSKIQSADNADSQLQISAPKYFNSKIMQDATQQYNEMETSNLRSTPDSTQNDNSKLSLPAVTHATDQSTNTVSMISLAVAPENTMSELGNHQLSTSLQSANENKENIEQHSSSSTSSDSETSDMAPCIEAHPAGITLHRVGYYTIPPMDELSLLVENGQCVVENFTVGRYNYGNVFFPESFDVAGLNLDEIVHIRHKEIVIYPDDDAKPLVGEGLNRPAQVTLDRVWPIDKTTRLPIVDAERLARMDYEATLRRACAKNNTKFKEYRPQTGSWVFKVDHFSKYGLSDSDEDEPSLSDVKKLKFTTGGPAALPPQTSKELQQSLKQQGLDRTWTTLNDQPPPTNMLVMEEDDQEMEDSLIKTPFDLDDDYQPTQKSPSMQLAQELGASSHKVQIMKATFFQEEQNNFNMVDDNYMNFRTGCIFDVEELKQGSKLNKSFPTLRTQFVKKQLTTATPSASLAVKVGTDVGEVITAMPSLGPTVGPPPPVHPQTVFLHYPGGIVCYADSTIKRVNAQCLADYALMKGRSFRVGWGKDCTLVSLTTQNVAAVTPLKTSLDELGNMLIGRVQPDSSPPIVQRIRILGGQMDEMCPDFQASIEEHLEIALEHSVQDGGTNSCPAFAPKSGIDSLHAHCSLAQRLAQSEISPLFTVSCHVWELCVALWGNLVDLPQHEPPESYKSMIVRRQAVSDWLMNVVAASIKQDLTVKDSVTNVFTLLTGHCVQEACQQAQSIGDHFAALLLSQLSGSGSVRSLMEQQLLQWKDAQADVLIDNERLKIMMLCAGIPVFQASNSVINVCEDLDWKRAFAVHFWYVCSPVTSITDALLKYESAFSSSETYACSPSPGYTTEVNIEWESSRGKPLYDVCYHLLKLYSTHSYPMECIINPATHTSDPLDYRLSWLLLQTLEALGYTHTSEFSSAHTHTSFASQLEAHGMWHWAVFVLLHITSPVRRKTAVLDTIGRHVNMNENSEEEQFLVDKLKIPLKWIFQAKAVYASTHNKYKEAAVFLIKAGQWNESHSIIMQHIAPRAIINGKYDYLASLLKEFVVEGRSKEISGWSHQGALLWDYLNVVQQVQTVVAKRDPNVGYHLEKLQPELSRLCARINLLPSTTSIHRLCQAEIAKRTAHLVRTVLILQKGGDDKTIGTSVRVLAHLVNQLPLPEDYTKQELQEIIATMVNNFGWQ